MKKRPTLADVAGVCGYSLSTVDRVLNARAPVREDPARRVFAAAEAVGYPLDARAATELIRQMRQDDLPAQGFQSSLPCLLYTPENC